MALGDGGNSFSTNKDNNNKNFDPTVYTPLRFKNPDAKADPSELSFSYWKNMLKVTISPKMEAKPDDKYIMYDHDVNNNGGILINPIKAKMLHDDIVEMMKSDGAINCVGVPSGVAGLITFSNGKEYGVDGYMLVIRKLDQNGNTISSYSYQFNNSDYYTSIRNFNESTHDYTKHKHERVEIDYFLKILKEFYCSQTYAYAYSNIDAGKFNNSRINTKIELVMDKLGIPKTSSNKYQNRGSSFFSEKGSNNESMQDNGYVKQSKSTTIEDLEGQLN